MRLVDALKQIPDEGYLRVGAASAWFYAGSTKEFKENLEYYSARCKKNADDVLKGTKDTLESMLRRDVSPATFARRVLSGTDGTGGQLTTDGYIAYAHAYFKQVRNAVKRSREAEVHKSNFTPLPMREVRSVEPAISEDDCTNIIVSGWERGGYWMLSEAEGRDPIAFSVGVGGEDE